MPMHDWTRITANNFHHFHGRWIYAIADALNAGLLPPSLRAMAEHSLRAVTPDVLTLEEAGHGERPTNGTHPVGTAALPETRIKLADKPQARTQTRRVAVRTNDGDRVVAIVELVSPGNKSKKTEVAAFVEKVVGALEVGVHALVVDPFPPGRHDRDGVHGAIWRAAIGRREPWTAGTARALASYVSHSREEYRAFVEPVAVGDPLRDMPLFISPDEFIDVPLEPTYGIAWNAFPATLRRVLAHDG